MKRVFISLILAGASTLGVQCAPVLQLTPSGGAVFGAPGATIGWGFTLTNSSDFLVITGSSFVPASLYGTYQDYAGTYNFLVAGPAPESTTVSQSFNSAAHSGLGAFTINSAAPPGTTIGGNLVVEYSLFSQDPNDPNFDPGTSLLVADATISQPATVNVTPEPDSRLLMLAVAFTLGAAAFRRRAILKRP